MNPRHVFKSKSKLLEGDIPPSEYQSLIKNPSRCFKKGSKVHVYFTIISEIYDPEPIIYSGKIFVDCENSMFKLFCDLLTVFHDEFAYDPSKDETKFWHLLNSPGQLYFPWDIFRLRAAVHSLLVDAANSGENTKIADGYLNAKRTFVLCNHKEKVSRRVQVEIDCSPDDVVNIE
uniref:Uncharacterized protein n=1 Tax=Panagrolaimus superbus TaxID=310955 RepID=A0A914Z9Q6_9BILA